MKKITVKDLTAEEKINLVWGKDFWHTNDLNGKLPYIRVTDASMGVRMPEDANSGVDKIRKSVAYPSIQVLANTWDLTIVKKYAECVASDCLDAGADIILGPGVNIKRSPLCGRNYEYFSEDPFLAGVMAKEYVCAVQNSGIGACVKHFCANNLEYNRQQQSSEIDERTLREVYYQPFRTACEAKPLSVMCSYNRINGVRGSENKKGFDILRNEYGFDGAVISDWGAVYDSANAVKAGCDLSMPYWDGCRDGLVEAYKSGELSESELDDCAQRVLDLIYRCKAMHQGKQVVKTEKKRAEAAKAIAADGMVLLKNDGLLPLDGAKHISVCGCFAKPDTIDMLRGGGSAGVEWLDKTFDIPAALERRGYAVAYEGAFRYDGVESFNQNARMALLNAAKSDVNIVCVGTGNPVEYEAGDRKTLRLPEVQERAILETAEQNENTIVVVFAGGAVDMSVWADKVRAILYAGFPGMGGDEVVADILTGKINPSGKLSETFPLSAESVPAVNAYRVAGVTRYQEGLDVGYRYFVTYEVPVLYPFGYGLSYSEFTYKELLLTAEEDRLRVSCSIENISSRDGKEIVQVYVRECAPLVYRPKKELKAFSKSEIKAGQTKPFEFVLHGDAFAHWSVAENKWEITDGVYEISVGASSQDIRLIGKITIENGKITVV